MITGRAGRGGDKPSEDQVEKLEEKLEAAQADQKNLFLIIFQVKQQNVRLNMAYHTCYGSLIRTRTKNLMQNK